MIRALLIDDEPLSRGRMRMFAGKHPDVEIVAEAADGQEALGAVAEHEPNVMFVDVEMPGLSGVDMVRQLDVRDRPLVVFVTAFADYAVEAFDVGAIHYLVKPFGSSDVDAAIGRIRETLAARAIGGSIAQLVAHLQKQQTSPTIERVVVKRNGRAMLLRVDQIDWIEGAGNYSRLHAASEHHLLRESMTALERKLDGRRFVRIHRSTLVNVDRIRELQPTSHGDYAIILHDATRLVLSRGYRNRIETVFGRL